MISIFNANRSPSGGKLRADGNLIEDYDTADFKHNVAMSSNESTGVLNFSANGSIETYPFKGFIYAFYINMAYVATGDFPHKKANCDDDCSGLSCTSVATDCVANFEFVNYDGKNLCEGSCSELGCRNGLSC